MTKRLSSTERSREEKSFKQNRLCEQKDYVCLTDHGYTINLIKKEKSLFLSLEVTQEEEALVSYSSFPNLENTMISFTQVLITINGLSLIEQMVRTKKRGEPLIMNNQNITEKYN